MKKVPVLNLQDVVDSYEEPAVLVSDQYEIICANSAYYQLYQIEAHCSECNSSEYLTADNQFCQSDISTLNLSKEQYCYAISHRYTHSCDQEGESCPLQLAKSTQTNQRVLHVHHTRYGEEHVDVSLYPIRDNSGEIYFLEVMKTIKHASPKSVRNGMVGNSPAFNKLLGLINRVAEYDISVLLQGESGSGKELVALAIHQVSLRSSMACVTVECSGLSKSLFESELFGHEKGAFTGAVNSKKGLVEEAENGTLFLDEIGDVPMSLQVKLLRLIETRTFRRVGGVEQLNADFRLICATHKNLQKMVELGEFREDLYYRISTFPIRLPALKDRQEDIPLLVDTILERITGQKKMQVSKVVMDFFKQYSFPGNIRQLRNVLEFGRVMSDSDVIEMEHLPADLFYLQQKGSTKGKLTDKSKLEFDPLEAKSEQITETILSLEEYEYEYLSRLQRHFKGDKAELARKLGISERTLYRKLSK